MKDYAELEKRLREKARYVRAFPTATTHHEDVPALLEEAANAYASVVASKAEHIRVALAIERDLMRERDEACAPKAAWNAAIKELAQMPECTAEALDKMRCLYTFIFDAVPEFTFEEEISDVVVRYHLRGLPMSFSFHFAKGMKAFPIWSDPNGLSRDLADDKGK